MAGKADELHVFLASPGDVGEERAFVTNFLEVALRKDLAHAGNAVLIDVVSWDHDADRTPLLATLTPQGNVVEGKRAPADCDIVVVIMWSRIGTPLDPAHFKRADGSAYESGTVWEFENAINSPKKPDVLVYRRGDPVPSDLNLPDADIAAQRDQQDKVRRFFAQFTNPDRSWSGSFETYHGLDDFRDKAANALRQRVFRKLRGQDQVPAAPEPPTVAIPLPDRCFGRESDTAAMTAALTADTPHIALLVHGPGGIGKTTLTQIAALAPSVAARFGHRRWFVELETATDRDSFDGRVLAALGIDPTQGFPAALSKLAQGPGLLVLDNLETPWGGDQLRIEARLQQLAAVPGLALLASFRGDAPVGGARWTRLPVRPLEDGVARQLFLDIAQTIPDGDVLLPSLLEQLGGVPLALCLTARRAAGHTDLRELWDEWIASGTDVARMPGAADHRLASVEHSIAFSLRAPGFGASGRRLFRLLGQLPAGIADADRRALLGPDAFAAREQVLAAGLAIARDGRLDLLPPVRDHARRRHAPEDADAGWRTHYLMLVASFDDDLFTERGAAAFDRLTPELPNLDAAIDAAIAANDLSGAVNSVHGIATTLRFTGAGGPRALTALAAACQAAGDERGAAVYHENLGDIALSRSDHDTARARFEEALPLYRRAGVVGGEANCIKSLGDIALSRSDHDTARARFEEALPLYRRAGVVGGEANCIFSLGDIALARSDHDTARARFEEALPLYRRAGDVLGEANCIKSLGDIALDRSDPDTARARFEDALPLYRRAGAVLGEANCIQSLGVIALERSDHDTARARFEEALPLYRRAGAVLGEANCIKSLGDIALRRSDHDTARARFEEALKLYRRAGAVRGEANCIQGLGNIALARSGHDTARARFEEALPLYRRVGDVVGEAGCEIFLGRLERVRKDKAAAQTHFQTALAMYERVHRLDGAALAHEDLATVTEGAERAAHIEAAKRIWTEIKLPDQAARVEQRTG